MRFDVKRVLISCVHRDVCNSFAISLNFIRFQNNKKYRIVEAYTTDVSHSQGAVLTTTVCRSTRMSLPGVFRWIIWSVTRVSETAVMYRKRVADSQAVNYTVSE